MDTENKSMLLKKFRSIDGKHCITKALGEIILNRSELFDEETCNEALLFGLDCGVDFVYRVMGENRHPPVFMGGRYCNWLRDFSEITGIGIYRNTTVDEEYAWTELKAQLDKGIPVLLEVDKYQIEYWKQIVGYEDYGGHLIVAVAYDDKAVYVSDQCCADADIIQKVSFSDLRNARKSPLFWKAPENSWYTFDFPKKLPAIEGMIKAAVKRNAERFLYPPGGEAVTGIKGLRLCAKEVPEWESWLNYKIKSSRSQQYVPAFDYQLFKVMKIIHGGRIAGGGNFRLIYAEFLHKAAMILNSKHLLHISEQFMESAQKWIRIYEIINENEMSEFNYRNGTGILKDIQSVLCRIADMEENLFHQLLCIEEGGILSEITGKYIKNK